MCTAMAFLMAAQRCCAAYFTFRRIPYDTKDRIRLELVEGRYRLLILDVTEAIIPHGSKNFASRTRLLSYARLHTPSHILPLLDVVCFSPLKRVYGEQVERQTYLGVTTSLKTIFYHYITSHAYGLLRRQNIKAGFAVAGLVPFNLELCS
jgi:hypothetical protein